MNVQPVTLEGRYVRLEPMSLEHYDAFAAIGLGHDIFRWYPFAVDTKDDMLAYMRASLAGRDAGTSLPFTTIERACLAGVPGARSGLAH